MPTDDLKIRDAVRDCLLRCRGKLPRELVPAIREFLKGLGDGWRPAEIRAVDSGVQRVLIFGAVLDGEMDAGAPKSLHSGR